MSAADSQSYEPSMEEILASIRRIIADDQSLPRAASEIDVREPAPETSWANERIEPTLVPHVAATVPEPAPLRAHLLRGETVELDFRAMAARQTGLAPSREAPPTARAPEVVARPDAEARFDAAVADPLPDPAPTTSRQDAMRDIHTEAYQQVEPRQDEMPTAHAPAEAAEDHTTPPPGVAPFNGGMAHGPIAAPQYAGPGGPDGHDDRVPRYAEASEPWTPSVDASRPSPMAEPAVEVFEDDAPDDYDQPLTGSREDLSAPVLASGHDGRPSIPSETLFSAATDTSVAAAFRTLAATRLADNSEELLDIAREMIRPLLKIWIDDNVPSMVERMVRAEIERVARGGR